MLKQKPQRLLALYSLLTLVVGGVLGLAMHHIIDTSGAGEQLAGLIIGAVGASLSFGLGTAVQYLFRKNHQAHIYTAIAASVPALCIVIIYAPSL